MTSLLKSCLDGVYSALAGDRSRVEISRLSESRLRDLGLDRSAVAPVGSDVPWQVAEHGGSGAKVQLHCRAAA